MNKIEFRYRRREERDELNKLALSKYNNQYHCDEYGRFPWDTEHRNGQTFKTHIMVSLSKASLGLFCYEILARYGQITSFYIFSNTPRAPVYPRVWLTLEARDDMIATTKFALNPPPVAQLN